MAVCQRQVDTFTQLMLSRVAKREGRFLLPSFPTPGARMETKGSFRLKASPAEAGGGSELRVLAPALREALEGPGP